MSYWPIVLLIAASREAFTNKGFASGTRGIYYFVRMSFTFSLVYATISAFAAYPKEYFENIYEIEEFEEELMPSKLKNL